MCVGQAAELYLSLDMVKDAIDIVSVHDVCVCVGQAAELYLSLDMVKDAVDIVSVHDVCVCWACGRAVPESRHGEGCH